MGSFQASIRAFLDFCRMVLASVSSTPSPLVTRSLRGVMMELKRILRSLMKS